MLDRLSCFFTQDAGLKVPARRCVSVLSHVGGLRAPEPDIHAPMAAAWQVVAITVSSISSMPKPIALATNTPVIRARGRSRYNG